MPLLAAESHRGWLSGRFLTSWLWIKKDRDEYFQKRDTIATKMTPAQILEAQKLAREWKPTMQPP